MGLCQIALKKFDDNYEDRGVEESDKDGEIIV